MYALTGGADFGAGVWSLLARWPTGSRPGRVDQHRKLIDAAMAPMWEANHIWIIFVIVLLFTGFPSVFAAMSIHLHLPLLLILVGITLRGAAFVFQHYGHGDSARRWRRIFAAASTVTPLLLGALLGAMTRGVSSSAGEVSVVGNVTDWLAPFPIFVGIFSLSLFTHLAAVFLTSETTDLELQRDFQQRALLSAAAAFVVGGLTVGAAHYDSSSSLMRFSQRLTTSWWTWPLAVAVTTAIVIEIILLRHRRFRIARWIACIPIAGILVGWGAAQYPILLSPMFSVDNAASPTITLRYVAPVVVAGVVMLLPCLYWLLRTFKREQRP
jgi:cytochrome bd ubiquinol oxidase subunit II